MSEDKDGRQDEHEEFTDISELLDEKKAVSTTHRKRKQRELTDLESIIEERGSDTRIAGTTRSGKLDDTIGKTSFLDDLNRQQREEWSKTLVLVGYALVGAGLVLILLLPQSALGVTLTSATLIAGVISLGLSFLL